MDDFEQFLTELSLNIDVDIMPGEQDFSNSFMPQQPFNSCVFPKLAKEGRTGINLVTNPHQFEINGFHFLGTSGQNIKDMMLNSVTERDDAAVDLLDDDQQMMDEEGGEEVGSEKGKMSEREEGDLCLAKLKQSLEMRHMCPTAPDTLRVYPFKD